jgi:type VII secretion protein EccB
MPSRQDQLHSYQFMVQRVVSALVLRETDPTKSPFRRAAGATLASVLIAVVIAAGFGIYGVFTSRGDRTWRTDGAVIVEKGTGAVYVWRDGKLHPALNLTSAYLASNAAKPTKFDVSAKSLQGEPWGPMIGISLLPDSLPGPKDLVGLPWGVCSLTLGDRINSAVTLGSQAIGGRVVAEDEAVLVEPASGGGNITYMLWRGRLFEAIDDAAQRLRAGTRPVPVSAAFIKGVSVGQPLKRIDVAGSGPWRGTKWTVGQVIKVTGGPQESFVLVRQEGLFWITPFQAHLQGGGNEVTENLSNLNGQFEIREDLLPKTGSVQDQPAAMPKIAASNGSLCSVVKDDAGNAELRTDVRLDLASRPPTSGRSDDGAIIADYVLVPFGKGALVTTSSRLVVSLVGQNGVHYAASGPDVLARLGYEGVTPTRVPADLLSLLPAGPGLDPQAARLPVSNP